MPSPCSLFRLTCPPLVAACYLFAVLPCGNESTGAESLLARGLATVTEPEVRDHIETLADDRFEGREAGSRGGQAAAGYLAQAMQQYGLEGAGPDKSFYQYFAPGYRNVLGLLPGSDPTLSQELVICCAHYDHVGYGTWETSRGPIGLIHNGADDNASGVSALLEIMEGLHETGARPERSILFAFWDGEEKGLLGSHHWLREPTVRNLRPCVVLNLDMVGRLTDGKLEIHATRSALGLRRKLIELNPHPAPFQLHFPWKLEDNSDHHPFVQAAIPAVMLHTGLHDDYHTPRDDPERINVAGVQKVTQFAYAILDCFANERESFEYRGEALAEDARHRKLLESPPPPAPPRLGMSWRSRAWEDLGQLATTTDDVDATSDDSASLPDGDDNVADRGARVALQVTRITYGLPASRAGLRLGDLVIEVNGEPVASSDAFSELVAWTPHEIELTTIRPGVDEPTQQLVVLQGEPTQLGITCKQDPAEPQTLLIVDIVPGATGHQQGLRRLDRIYRVDRVAPESPEHLAQLLTGLREVTIELERKGELHTVVVRLPTLYRRPAADSIGVRSDRPAPAGSVATPDDRVTGVAAPRSVL